MHRTYAMTSGILLTLMVESAFSQPVQWRIEDGGNGHWYSMIPLQSDCWDDARDQAQSMGADLAVSKDALTNQFIYSLIESIPGVPNVCIGGSYDFSDAIWKWVDGTPFDYTNWQPGEPGCCAPEEYWLDINPATGRWRDRRLCVPPTEHPPIAVIEWSADCNSDGIVDFGQLLDGTLIDADVNGIPDICEQCPPDFDDNNLLNFFDVAAFVVFFQIQDPRADFNADGLFNFFDFSEYLTAFNAGCP